MLLANFSGIHFCVIKLLEAASGLAHQLTERKSHSDFAHFNSEVRNQGVQKYCSSREPPPRIFFGELGHSFLSESG